MTAGPESGDRIEIRDLRVLGVHGVLPEERERAQPFSIDLVAWVDMAAAQRSDELADTVDYGALAQTAAEVVGQQSFRLVETLATRLAEALLISDARLEAVEVTVRKLRPPLALDVASTGVRVLRTRQSWSPGIGDPL
jgi:dihydroneopterin aldolase